MPGPEDLAGRFSSVLAEAEAERAADAMAVATAVYARVELADRLRAAIGTMVLVRTSGGVPGAVPAGRIVEVTNESVTLAVGPQSGRLMVRLCAVASVRGLPSGHRRAEGAVERRRGFAATLRPLVGSRVEVSCDQERLTGVLARVGADHLELATASGAVVIAFPAISWVAADGSHIV